MKKQLHGLGIAFVFAVVFTNSASAQMMMENPAASDNHAAKEEVEGKALWDKFQTKQIACANLSDNDFDVIGEYFMGQMMGASHDAMNTMMTQMMDEQGETQMHIALGKRVTGCDSTAAFPESGKNFLPMMQGTWNSWSERPITAVSPFGINQMMNYGFGHMGFSGGIVILLWWALVIAGIVALVKWILNQGK